MVRLSIAILLVLISLTVSTLMGCAGTSENTTEWHVDQGIKLTERGRYDEAIEECNRKAGYLQMINILPFCTIPVPN